jgi:hypothetical protein
VAAIFGRRLPALKGRFMLTQGIALGFSCLFFEI